MMNKMTTEENHLYTRYFYNSVIEFIYFVILYLEAYETASPSNLNKYVKFFKTEVTDLISSFKGKVPADKLIEMLKFLDCFIIHKKEVRLDKGIKYKDVIFEDFVLSKCVDLLLRKPSNMDTMYENINFNSVIKVTRKELSYIIKKYSYISVHDDQTVTLHHFHGLIGFEDYICKTVIGYFHNILHHSKVLSYEDIRNHSKSLSVCGLNNVIEILCILYCSHQFICQDGFICLNKKSKKHLKQKPILVQKMETDFSSRSVLIGHIVYAVYGPSLHQWIGEIGTIKKNCGTIYCVVDFTDGHQEVFNIFFSKAALKVISELDDLEKYLNVRDGVEFDAEFYKGKMVDRCWKATRVKLCSNKFQYDEILSDKLNHDTDLERSKCSNNKWCSKKISKSGTIVSNSQNVKKKNYEEKHVLQKKLKTSDYDSCSSSDSYYGSEIGSHNNSDVSHNQIISTNFSFDISNYHVLDYLFMFGHVYLLMEDKGLAIAKYKSKFYNILFMKDSIYMPVVSEDFFVKGQKILAIIPYLKNPEKLESISLSILVYGLSEEETNETENMNISPEDFSTRILFSKLNSLCGNRFSCPFNSLSQQFLNSGIKYKVELTKLYEFLKSQYRLPFTNGIMLLLLHNVEKATSSDGNFDLEVFKFFMKLVKCLPRYVNGMKMRRKNKRKIVIPNFNDEFNAQEKMSQQNLYVKSSKKRFCSETDVPNLFISAVSKRVNSENGLSNLFLTTKPDSSLSCSQISFSSYKTCSTSNSEVFYSCESEFNSPNKISTSVSDNDALDIINSESSVAKIKIVPEIEVIKPFPTVFNGKCDILPVKSSQCCAMKVQKKFLDKSNLKDHKYLSLQSIRPLKCSLKNRRRSVSSCSFKTIHKDCITNPVVLKSRVSLISNSFIFFATNIDGCDVILPFPKKNTPCNLLENVKLNAICEITVIPNAVLNLSHVLKFHLII